MVYFLLLWKHRCIVNSNQVMFSKPWSPKIILSLLFIELLYHHWDSLEKWLSFTHCYLWIAIPNWREKLYRGWKNKLEKSMSIYIVGKISNWEIRIFCLIPWTTHNDIKLHQFKKTLTPSCMCAWKNAFFSTFCVVLTDR